MTELTKKLSREIPRTLDLDRQSRGRFIVIEIEPPDLVSFRFKGTRRKYTATAARLMQWTIQAQVEQERREKARLRKSRRGSK